MRVSDAPAAAHVLIVEDSSDVALALQLVMEAGGHDVSTAMTVDDAVRRGLDRAVDVLLLDLTLPDGSGLDVLRRLAAEGCSPRHTIALTGHDEADVRQQCLASGCGEVMVKPVPMRVLMQRVSELASTR